MRAAPVVCALLAAQLAAQLTALLTAPPLVAQSQQRALAAAALEVAQGRFAEAESRLFDASMRAPRDPAVREALGSFLAARGRLRVGLVLLEEARLFGGDPGVIDARMLHISGWLGEWKPAAPLIEGARGGPARARHVYLAKNPSVVSGGDSSVLRLDPNDLAGLGRISIEVGGVAMIADIDPTVDGLVLPAVPGMLGAVESFGTEGSANIAVAKRVVLGATAISNVPARVEAVNDARVGLDVLGRLAPTFDAAGRTLVVHAGGAATGGESFALLLTFPGVRIATRPGAAPVPLESAPGRAALRGFRWTLDLKRGAVTVHR